MNLAPASIAPLQVSGSNTEPAPITTSLFEAYFSTKASIIERAPGTVYVNSIAHTPPAIQASAILIASSLLFPLTTATTPIAEI